MTDLIQRIHSRCVDDGDCLIWQGRVAPSGMPIMTASTGATVSVRRALYEQRHGEIPHGLLVTPTCGHKCCMRHLEAMTPKKSKAVAARRGAFSNPARARKAALTLRARSHITDEVVARIKQAETARLAHEATGVDLSYVYQIRAGTARREFVANPFAGLGARA